MNLLNLVLKWAFKVLRDGFPVVSSVGCFGMENEARWVDWGIRGVYILAIPDTLTMGVGGSEIKVLILLFVEGMRLAVAFCGSSWFHHFLHDFTGLLIVISQIYP